MSRLVLEASVVAKLFIPEDFSNEALPTTLVADVPLLKRALELAEQYGLSAYDAQYVALADMLNCDVWTADEGLIRAAGGRLQFIKWIGSYAGLSDT